MLWSYICYYYIYTRNKIITMNKNLGAVFCSDEKLKDFLEVWRKNSCVCVFYLREKTEGR